VLRRAYAKVLAPPSRLSGALLLAALLLVFPAVALAGSGGSALSGSTTPSWNNPTAPRVNRTETASGSGITVGTRATGVLTWETRFFGKAPRRDRGRVVEIERTAKPGSSRWVLATRATVASNGSFGVNWRANQVGKLAFRAVLMRRANVARAAATTPSLRKTVYHLSKGSWYGPGFFGHRTACGQTLRRTTLGVANRTLKCGTKVSILYNGRMITVPVIDRGPYTTGVYWDLTQATAQALDMTETSRIGTLY
jgi:hypothetical protein